MKCSSIGAAFRFSARASTTLGVPALVAALGVSAGVAAPSASQQRPDIVLSAAPIAAELDRVPWGVTCEEWSRRTGGPAICEPFRSVGQAWWLEERWCFRGRTDATRGEPYFYLIDPLAGDPACTLERYEVVVEVDPEHRAVLSDSLRAALARRLSASGDPERTDRRWTGWRAAPVARWITDEGVLVLLATDSTGRRDPPIVSVVAASAAFRAAAEEPLGPPDAPRSAVTAERADSLARLLDGVVAGAGIVALPSPRVVGLDSATFSAVAAGFAGTVAETVDAAGAALDAVGRHRGSEAAILLAADLLASRATDLENFDAPEYGDSTLVRALAALGLRAGWEPLGSSLFTDLDLLHRVVRDHAGQPWADVAYLRLLDRGWSGGAPCFDTMDVFRPVIDQGEAFLEANPDHPLRAEFAWRVALAYETWWSLSNAGEDPYAEASRYREGASRARRGALRHFAEVAESDLPAEIRRYAREHAALLGLELDPAQREYFCVYD